MLKNRGIIEAVGEKKKSFDEVNYGTEKRKSIIKRIQKETGRKLIIYISNHKHPLAAIGQDDIAMLDGMINSIKPFKKLDFLIHTPGGDGNSAEKMVKIIWDNCTSFRAIVANSAKSAGTLIALASEKIMMGYLSELGPIDPQIVGLPPVPYRSAHNYIDKFEEILKISKKQKKLTQADAILLNKIDLSLWRYCENQVEWAVNFADEHLSKYMFKGEILPTIKKISKSGKTSTVSIAKALSADQLNHGKIIMAKEARDHFQLKIILLSKSSILWKLIWELQCNAELAINDNKLSKLWESESKSMRITSLE